MVRGQNMVEMGLVMGLIAILAVGILLYFGDSLFSMFRDHSGGESRARERIHEVVK